MEQLAIHNYLHSFFTLNKCKIEENVNGKLTVQLTEELDRLLMNRPFYWEYIKKMGQEGTPATLTFVSNPKYKDTDGEWIHFGSPRLHQIFRSQLEQGKYTLVYEQAREASLKPWLVVNISISYKGRQKKEELLSIGLQLINGTMVLDFMEKLKPLQFSNMISDYCFTISPIIRIPSAYKRIENYVKEYIQEQDHTWAEDANRHFEKEKDILEHFYKTYLENATAEEKEELTNRFESERKDLEKRLLPEVDISVINGGLFYISDSSSSKIVH